MATLPPLFRFMSADSMVRSLERRSLRVGKLAELNDPFEWRVGMTGYIPEAEQIVRSQVDAFIRDMSETYGVLCCSDTAAEPVLWSHYSDHHRGACLEIRAPDCEHFTKMEYTNERPCVDLNWLNEGDPNDPRIRQELEKMMVRKSASWSYEREYRAFLDLNECMIAGGSYFRPIPDGYLHRVILGFRCDVSEQYVKRLLSQAELHDVETCRADEQSGSYLMKC